MTSLLRRWAWPCPAMSTRGPGTVRLAVNLDARDLPLAEPAGPGARRALLRGARCPGGRRMARRPSWRDRRPRLPEHRHRHRGGRRARRAAADAATTVWPARSGTASPIRTGPMCPCGLRGCLEAIAAGPRRGARRPDGASTPASHRRCATWRRTCPSRPRTCMRPPREGDALALRVTRGRGRGHRPCGALAGAQLRRRQGGHRRRARAGPAMPSRVRSMRSLEEERSASALVRRAFLGTRRGAAAGCAADRLGSHHRRPYRAARTRAIESERRQARSDER